MARGTLGMALIALSLGCGDIVPAPGNEDAAPKPDATPTEGEVTVVIVEGTEPVVGAPVFLNGPDGEPVGEVETGADGEVTIPAMPLGGFVTAVHGSADDGYTLTSVGGLADGDRVVFAVSLSAVIGLAGSYGGLELSLPVSSGVVKYDVDFTCNNVPGAIIPPENFLPGASMVTFPVSDRCDDVEALDVLLFGLDGSDQRIKSTYALALPINHANAGSGNPIAVKNDFDAPVGLAGLTVNTPAGLSGVTGTLALQPYGSNTSLQNGVSAAFPADGTSLTLAVAPGYTVRARSVLDVVPMLQTAGERVVVESVYDATSLSQSESDEFTLPAPFPVLDANPTIELDDGVTITYAPADGVLACGDLGGPHAAKVTLSGKIELAQYRWSVLVPATTTTVTFPRLGPTADALFFPRDLIDLDTVGIEVLARYPDGYQGIKENPGGQLATNPGDQGCSTRIQKVLP